MTRTVYILRAIQSEISSRNFGKVKIISHEFFWRWTCSKIKILGVHQKYIFRPEKYLSTYALGTKKAVILNMNLAKFSTQNGLIWCKNARSWEGIFRKSSIYIRLRSWNLLKSVLTFIITFIGKSDNSISVWIWP